MPELFWIENRINYRNMCRLCEVIDKAIGPITMVSFGNNLYFVCVQLLKSLKFVLLCPIISTYAHQIIIEINGKKTLILHLYSPMPSAAHAVYFWFSLTFLITRTLAVSLYSSAINDQSKIPLHIFRACPSQSWCLEVSQ